MWMQLSAATEPVLGSLRAATRRKHLSDKPMSIAKSRSQWLQLKKA